LSDEQRRRGAKDPATLGAEFWRAAGGVAPQSQSAEAMLLRRALPAARQNLAHSFRIYEMGSNVCTDGPRDVQIHPDQIKGLVWLHGMLIVKP
jgi:hypothetical protein